MRSAIGIDIGGTNFRIGWVREDGAVLCSDKKPSKALGEGGKAADLLAGEIRAFMDANEVRDARAIGIGFPAPVCADGKRVFPCPNLKNTDEGFDGIDVVSRLEGLGLPVAIAKDTDMLLQAEIMERHTGPQDIVTAFYFGTGVGNSVYYRGSLLRGAHGSGCDAGHIPVLGGMRTCGCGKKGCIECYASGAYLVSLWKERFADCALADLFRVHKGARELAAFVEACANPVAAEVAIFDPTLVILGGGILEMDHFPYKELTGKIYEHVKKPYPAENMVIERAAAADAGIRGAAWYALSHAL